MNRYQTPLLNFLLAIIGDYDIAHDRAPGIILVLQGHMTWGPWRRGYRPAIFPSHVVAKETVRINSMYRFVLFPGHYVLTARFPHSKVRPFVQIVVKEGIAVHIDVPNMCM